VVEVDEQPGTVRSVAFDLQPMALEDATALHDHAMKHAVGQRAAR
jgi:hypothetical protein